MPTVARLNRQLLVESYRQDYSLDYEDTIRDGDHCYHLLVFQSLFQCWPGEMRQEIVLTDPSYQVVAVNPNVRESIFVSANVSSTGGRDLLVIRRSIRPGFQQEIVSYECRRGGMHEVNRALEPRESQFPSQINLRDFSRSASDAMAQR
jgi:hypothetical protein